MPLLEGSTHTRKGFFFWAAVIMRYVESGTDPTHTTDGSALLTPLPCGSGDHVLRCPPGRILAWNRVRLGWGEHVMRLVFPHSAHLVLDFRPHFFLYSKMSPRSVCPWFLTGLCLLSSPLLVAYLPACYNDVIYDNNNNNNVPRPAPQPKSIGY